MLHALLVLRCLVLLKCVEANNILRGADGNFGTSTHNAVIKFQNAKNISADGIVGVQTWSKLFK